MKFKTQLIYWIVATAILIIIFGFGNNDFITSFYFVSFLIPVAILTSFIFNQFLVPRYLLTKKYFLFGLYLIYLLIFSVYLEFLVLTGTFILLANYRYENLHPYSTNIFLLTATVYLIVFINAFIQLINSYQKKGTLIDELQEAKLKNEVEQLVVRSDRKNVPIPIKEIRLIESLADYVKIHTETAQIITKEKISELESKLPYHFIRIHRSFLVNKYQLETYNREKVQIGAVEYPISRTYKTSALEKLES